MTSPASTDYDSIAIVGLACRFPDADDAAALFQVITAGRRAFRRIPPCRVDLADYYSSNPGTADATYSTRAALIEGWRFDRAAFGISPATWRGADPAHWLALETAARALAAAGLAGGPGLPQERAAVFIGNTLTGDVSRTAALRLRWPYSRQVLADALSASGAPPELARRVLRTAAAGYLAPFAPVTGETLDGCSPGTIAATIGAQFGLQGGGFAVDAGGASSLAAVASACSTLSTGEIDFAVAGGVEVSLDPLDLVGLAKAGLLATSEMRIYDQNPTGFLPGEGCGVVLLMRSADARNAGLPVYAEIHGWGMASPGKPHPIPADPATILLAMRRAYAMAGVDPADVQFIEGCGTAVGHADNAELTALTRLRSGARQPAAFGSIAANIGNTRAAAGIAGLIKTILVTASAVIPPATGIGTPHELLRGDTASLRLPEVPEAWPEGPMRAGVSACGTDGLTVHLVVGHEPSQRTPTHRAVLGSPLRETDITARSGRARSHAASLSRSAGQPSTFLVQAQDGAALTAILARLADVVPWLSDAEFSDLACQYAGEAADQSRLRVAIVATRQEQLAKRASETATLVPRLVPGTVVTRPGIYAADGADGAVTLLLAGDPAERCEPARQLSRALAVLRRLDDLGVRPRTVVGHGAGELASLVWADCLSAADARALNALRCAALAAPPTAAPGALRRAIDEFAAFDYGPPRCRVISGCTGRELANAGEIAELLSVELLDARATADGSAQAAGDAAPAVERLAAAVRAGASTASLLLQSGQDRGLTAAIARLDPAACDPSGQPPVVTIDGDPGDESRVALAAGALFAAGALTRPHLLYADRPARPIDIWREQVFITSPCQTRPAEPSREAAQAQPTPEPARPAPQQPAPQTTAPQQPAPQTTAPRTTASPATRPAPARWLTGVGPWARCYAEQLVEPVRPFARLADTDDRPWHVYTAGDIGFPAASELFTCDPAAERTVLIAGRMHEPGTAQAALHAAQDAIRTGKLLAISSDPGLTGLWSSLHAEHPGVGITSVRVPFHAKAQQASADALRAAARLGTEPGSYRELAIAADGTISELAMSPLELSPGTDFPVGPDDVVLISRNAGAPGVVLAQVLACSGATIAVIGREHPPRDDAIIETLEQLRLGGATVGYEIVDLASTAALNAAVRRIELRLGRVTAVAHAAGATPPRPIAETMPSDLSAQVLSQPRALEQLVTAVRARDGIRRTPADQLKLVLTFGSVTGRYGLAGHSMVALSDALLADYGELLAAGGPGCQAIHVQWPAWAGAGPGGRHDLASQLRLAGFASTPVATGSRLLLKLLAADHQPSRVAIHGRLGEQAPAPLAVAARSEARDQDASREALPHRFAERVRISYPGAELITEASITRQADPYLADYVIDGVGVMPPAMAIEAMAQVAAELAGRPLRSAMRITMNAPIVPHSGPAPSVVRICAQRTDDEVSVVIRTASTDFTVEHFLATFSAAQDETGKPAAQGRGDKSPRRRRPARAEAAGLLGAGDIYGSVCFQTGRFRRLTSIRMTGSRAATGTMAGPDERPWFTTMSGAVATSGPELVLGSAAIHDAACQVIQACVPHRRLLFAGCEAATFAGREVAGTVTILAAQLDLPRQAGPGERYGQGGASQLAVPRPRTGDQPAPVAVSTAAGLPDTIWNVHAVDDAGDVVLSLRGLRMRDAGPLPRQRPWPVQLAGSFLERATAELGLGADLEVRVGRRADTAAFTEGEGWTRAFADGGLAGLSLLVRASTRTVSAWRSARPARKGAEAEQAQGWLAFVDGTRPAGADTEARRAMASAIASCAGTAAPIGDLSPEVRQVAGSDWLLVRTSSGTIACGLIWLAGVAAPVAIAIMTGALSGQEQASPAAGPDRAAISR